MKRELLLGGCLLVCLLPSCKNPVDNHREFDEDLIHNSSFEVNGNPTTNGWTYFSNLPPDTLQGEFSHDVPPSGGNWSLVLTVGDRVFRYWRTTIAAPGETNRYRLSVWAKAYRDTPISSPSYVALALDGTILKRQDIQDSTWRYYETIDTVSTQLGDTLTVELNAGTAYRMQRTYFDLCRLELLK